MGLQRAGDVTHRKHTEDLGDFEKVSRVELSPASGENGWHSLARRGQASGLCGRCHTCWGEGKWKSQNRKNVYLSPYVEEPLNSKVIKSFVPELRIVSVFRVSRSYVLCYIYMNIICPFRVAISRNNWRKKLSSNARGSWGRVCSCTRITRQFTLPRLQLLKYPTVSLNCYPIAQPDFLLFLKFKSYLLGHHFGNNDEVIFAMEEFWEDNEDTFFRDGIAMLEHHWTKCIDPKKD